MNLVDYTKLKSELEAKQRLSNKAEGALAQLESQLMQEFGIELEYLPEAITKLEERVKQEEKRIEKDLDKWKERWGDKLQ